MGKVPQVTGLRPMFGPSTGGTRLTIRGAALGQSRDDIVDVRVCGVSVIDSLEYVSPSKLIVLTKPCNESGSVVVITASGGKSVSQLTFVVEIVPETAPVRATTVGMMSETDVWCEEVPEDSGESELNPADIKDRDPLHLNLPPPDDATLIRQRQTLAALQKSKPDASPLLSDVNFDPVLCLASTYNKATLDALQDGLDHLRTTSGEAGAELKNLLNVDAHTFISAYAQMAALGSVIASDRRSVPNGDLTAELRECCTKVLRRSEKLFNPILVRADKAQSNSNAKRFLADNSFLFDLPRNLHACIEANHWTQAVQDYKQAMVFFDQTKSTIVTKLVENVKNIADEMRAKLLTLLSDMSLRFSEKEKIIEHLRELDPGSEPAWFAMEKQASYIMTQLNEMVDELYEAQKKTESAPAAAGRRRWSQLRTLVKVGSASAAAAATGHERRLSAGDLAHWRTSLSSEPGRSNSSTSISSSSVPPDVRRQNSVELTMNVMAAKRRLRTIALPPRVQLVEKACQLLSEQLPVFWRLGELYYPPFGPATTKRRLQQRRRSTVFELETDVGNFVAGKLPNAEGIEQRRRQIDDYAINIVRQFATVLREQFLDVQGDAALMDASAHSWLPDLTMRINTCFRLAQTANLPKKCLKELESLMNQQYLFTLRLLFQLAEADISRLQETWKPLPTGTHTQLPIQFQNIVSTTLSVLAGFVNDQANFDEMNVEQYFCHTFESFKNIMERQTFDQDALTANDEAAFTGSSSDITPLEKRLLYSMTSAHYTREVVAPALAAQYDNLRLELTSQYQNMLDMLLEFQQRCMNELVQLKSADMVELLQEALPEGLDVLPAEPQPRMYVKQVLRDMVLLHARVAQAARGFTGRALRAVALRLAETCAASLQNVALSSPAIRRQVQLEIFVFATVLRPFDMVPSMWLPALNTILSKVVMAAKKSTPRKLPTPGTPVKRTLPTPGATRHKAASNPELPANPMAVPDDIKPQLDAYIDATRFQYACFAQAAALDVDSDSDVEV